MRLTEKLISIYFSIIPMRFTRYHAYRVLNFVKNASTLYNKENIVVLDIGAGSGQYSKYFYNANYLMQDIKQNESGDIDFVCDIVSEGKNIPSEFADIIICTQVLEHIRDPKSLFQTFSRVLKDGGRLYLTTHMAFEEHMKPHDYFRFTRFGLSHLGSEYGLKMIHYDSHGGVFQLINYLIGTLPIRLFAPNRQGIFYYLYVFFATPFLIFSGALSEFMDSIFKNSDEITINMECVYVKTKAIACID